jgi:hypothetical protein
MSWADPCKIITYSEYDGFYAVSTSPGEQDRHTKLDDTISEISSRSKDCRWVAEHKLFDLTGQRSAVTLSTPEYYASPVFSPDSKWLVYQAQIGNSDSFYFYSINLQTMRKTKLRLPKFDSAFVDFTPSGDKVFISAPNSEIQKLYWADLNGTGGGLIDSGTRGGYQTHDKIKIVYTKEQTDKIDVMVADSLGRKTKVYEFLKADQPYNQVFVDAFGSFADTNKFIITIANQEPMDFAGNPQKRDQILLLDTSTQTVSTLFEEDGSLFGTSLLTGIHLSPDKSHLIYVYGDHIFSSNISTLARTQLPDEYEFYGFTAGSQPRVLFEVEGQGIISTQLDGSDAKQIALESCGTLFRDEQKLFSLERLHCINEHAIDEIDVFTGESRELVSLPFHNLSYSTTFPRVQYSQDLRQLFFVASSENSSGGRMYLYEFGQSTITPWFSVSSRLQRQTLNWRGDYWW